MMDVLPGDSAGIGTTWFWFSLPLIITVFFRFGRVWSMRNLDLLLLLGVAVGVVLVRYEPLGEIVGIAWLLSATGLLLARLLYDPVVKRRPLIEANLPPQALTFLGISGVALLAVSIVATPLPEPSEQIVERGEEVLHGQAPLPKRQKDAAAATSGLTSSLVAAPAVGFSAQVTGEPDAHDTQTKRIAAGLLAGLGHLAVLAALIFIGVRHFNDRGLGLAMGVLYLLLPSTVLDPNSVTHVLSAALVIWALALYRKPWAAGVLMGLACGSLLYPAFLLPVWFVFYGRAGSRQFGIALAGVWAVLLGGLALLSADLQDYLQNSLQLVAAGVRFLVNGESPLTWRITDELYRIPIFVSFVLMVVALVIWPAKKRFEHLLAHAAAIIVGIQFWYPQQSGEYLTGYIPLVLLVAFRPKLSPTREAEQDRILRRDSGRKDEVRPPEPALIGAGTSERLFR